jgi:hypothetical protein
MNIQSMMVIVIVVAAIVYAGVTLRKRSRAFAPKAGCGDDCGCNDGGK